MRHTAQTFPFETAEHGDAPRLEPLSEPLYCSAVYPEGQADEITFWPYDKTAVASYDVETSNVRRASYRDLYGRELGADVYYHLPTPQRFLIIGLAMRPTYAGERWVEVERLYKHLREMGTYRLTLGTKSYSEGPLDHVLSWCGDPSKESPNLDEFWPVTVTTQLTRYNSELRTWEPTSEWKTSPITLPPGQTFNVNVRFRKRLEMPVALPLRCYLIGCRLREVA